MHSVGVDIIEIPRIRQALDRWGERFLSRVYTGAELKICRANPERLAGRFAAKEAVMKALGTGVRGVGWREIEVLPMRGGKPLVFLSGRARDRAEAMGLSELAISLTHSNEFAIASVVGALD